MDQETYDSLPTAPWLDKNVLEIPDHPMLCNKGVEKYEPKDYGSRPGERGPKQVGFDNVPNFPEAVSVLRQ